MCLYAYMATGLDDTTLHATSCSMKIIIAYVIHNLYFYFNINVEWSVMLYFNLKQNSNLLMK